METGSSAAASPATVSTHAAVSVAAALLVAVSHAVSSKMVLAFLVAYRLVALDILGATSHAFLKVALGAGVEFFVDVDVLSTDDSLFFCFGNVT